MRTLLTIQEVSEADPDRPALFCEGKLHSYADLADAIGSIQHAIQDSGLGGAERIGILTGDDFLTYASIFAILANGSAYVPLNKNNPQDRTMPILEDAGVRLVLCSKKHGPLLEAVKTQPEAITVLDTGGLERTTGFCAEPCTDDQLVYLLFTSGSTGRPKGVPIYYSNLESYLKVLTDSGIHDFSAEDRFLQMFELTFDFSVMALFTPLTLGASCFVVPEQGFVYMNIIRMLTEQSISVAPMVPSALAYMSRFFFELRLEALRFSIFCGEALPDSLVGQWAECIPNARIQNCYGPTEATVYCLSYEWDSDSSSKEAVDGIVPIGKPMPGTSVIVLGEDHKEVRVGERGELCLGGPQVTSHYWKDAEMTEAAFFENPRQGVTQRFYRTGDICFQNREGDYIYCGRKDFQVKIDGHRIELGEIEHHAREFTGEPMIAAVPVAEAPGTTSLYLFVQGDSLDEISLAAHLKKKLPAYMQPRRIIRLPKLPLNKNGKIDRPALNRSVHV